MIAAAVDVGLLADSTLREEPAGERAAARNINWAPTHNLCGKRGFMSYLTSQVHTFNLINRLPSNGMDCPSFDPGE